MMESGFKSEQPGSQAAAALSFNNSSASGNVTFSEYLSLSFPLHLPGHT